MQFYSNGNFFGAKSLGDVGCRLVASWLFATMWRYVARKCDHCLNLLCIVDGFFLLKTFLLRLLKYALSVERYKKMRVFARNSWYVVVRELSGDNKTMYFFFMLLLLLLGFVFNLWGVGLMGTF